MKIALYSPNYPPVKCGVGDFTFCLAGALKNSGHEVEVYSGVQLKGVLPFQAESEALIQYTPYLFPSLKSCFGIFKKHRGRASIFFHELYFPPSWSIRGIAIGVPHWCRFLVLLHFSKQAIFSTAGFHSTWSKRLPYLKQKMFWVPVGSTIPIAGGAIQTSSPEISLVHFGGAHPTHLYEFVFRAFREACQFFGDDQVRLDLIGVVKGQFPHVSGHPGIHFHGYVDSILVSQKIRSATLILAPFLDGATTRRSTLMCALSHGKPVVTTLSDGPDSKSTPWAQSVATTSMQSAEAEADYARQVLVWLKAPEAERNALSIRAKQFYEQNFTWDRIAQRLLKILE